MSWLAGIGRWLLPADDGRPYPTAFASLETVSEAGLVTFDRVTRQAIGWDGVKRITAAMGRQQYDRTICLNVDLRGGKTVFLPETHPDWGQFLTLAERHLPAMLAPDRWIAPLRADETAVIRVYPA